MKPLPKRIKVIRSEQIPTLKKFRDLFIIFWLLHMTGLFIGHAMNFLNEESAFYPLLFFIIVVIGLCIEACGIVFLIKTTNRLYKYSALYIILYLISLIAPFGGLISILVFASVVSDSSTVFKYFKESKGAV